MDHMTVINRVIGAFFLICYAYQFIYTLTVLFRKEKVIPFGKANRFAVMICARNEERVIGDLIESIHNQTYDQKLIRIFVLADNCSDRTAYVARQAGATVYERYDEKHVGKGYALSCLMRHMQSDSPEGFDGYLVFDADNILAPDYIEQMNRTFSEGHDIVIGYRNSKNYGDNWISAGTGLWYLHESRYLNHARHILGISCHVNGTGFLFSRKVAEELGPWPFHCLVEDIEFSANEILKGYRIAFCPTAMLYDEQPTDIIQSWRQRRRWCRGGLQIYRRYGLSLARGAFHGCMSCFDLIMSTMPAYLLSVISLGLNLLNLMHCMASGESIMTMAGSLLKMVIGMYVIMYTVGLLTTVTEWRNIRTSPKRKILFIFTFPLFMITYIPVAVSALLFKVEWKPVEHRVTLSSLRMREDKDILPF